MKTLLIVLTGIILVVPARAQHLTSATAAVLQVYLQKMNGDKVILTCNDLSNQYNQLNMTGKLDVRSLITDDPEIRALLDSTDVATITYSTEVPEGDYVFGNTVNYQFTSETDLKVDDFQSRFIMDYEISNRKISDANTFAVTCSGTLSLKDNFGVSGKGILQDQVSFQIFQTVRSLNY